MLFPEFGYVPIWDGRVYSNCVIDAAANGLTLDSLRCAGHPSQGYALFLALPQLVRLGDVSLLHLMNTLLGLLALVCIRVVLSRVFPARDLARQLDLLTLACAVHPVLLSTLLQVNIDFGVYVFFFASLAALLSERFAWTAIAGLALCFSKETGVLAYGLMLGLFALCWAVEGKGTPVERLRRIRPMWITTAPIVAFGAYVAWWNATHAQGALWKHAWQQRTVDGFNFFDLSEPIFQSYAAGIFVLGFMWVATAVIGADLLVGGIRMAKRLPRRELHGADDRLIRYVGLLTALLIYALTSFRTWTNLRYFALVYPLLVLLAFAALLRLGAGARTRITGVVALTMLFTLAAYRSDDPISKAVYGTFSIGDRSMYRMTPRADRSGPGRDALVYNLEFTGFHHVQNALYRQIRPTDSTAIATSRAVNWNLWSPLDPRTLRRTLTRDSGFVPRYADEIELAANPDRPPDLWFLEFSNQLESDRALESMGALYTEVAILRVRARGHLLKAHHLILRETPLHP